MKNLFTTILFFSLLILASCSTTKDKQFNNSSKPRASTVDKSSRTYTSVADYLRANTNIVIQGNGNNVKLSIRGTNSLTSDTRPFFYVNKTPIGRDYVRVNTFVNPNDITRVKVLSSLADLTRYGQEGHSGIVILYTKSDSSK